MSSSSTAHDPRRDSQIPGNRNSQMTTWPSDFEEEQDDIEMARSRRSRNSLQRTSTFDAEAAASRMSFYVGEGLFPPPSSRVPDQWTGQDNHTGDRKSRNKRASWIQSVLINPDDNAVPIWQGNFDVEKRQSFATRASGGSESWYRESTGMQGLGLPRMKDPLTQQQMSQADTAGGLVSKEILMYPFPGDGTAESPFMVSWIENDPANPLNFTKGRKWMNAGILAIAVWTVSIASSGFSQGWHHSSTLLCSLG